MSVGGYQEVVNVCWGLSFALVIMRDRCSTMSFSFLLGGA